MMARRMRANNGYNTSDSAQTAAAPPRWPEILFIRDSVGSWISDMDWRGIRFFMPRDALIQQHTTKLNINKNTPPIKQSKRVRRET